MTGLFKKWFIHCETDMAGTDSYELIEAKTERDAEDQANDMAQDNFYSYDWEQLEEDCEEDGIEFIESEYYSYTIEEYNPEKHNDYLYDSTLKEQIGGNGDE